MHAAILILVVAGMAVGAAPPAALTGKQATLLLRRTASWEAGLRAWKEGRQAEAIVALEEVLRIELAVHGPWHREPESTADRLGDWHQERGEWAKSAECRRVVIAARRRLDGEGHWRTVDARLELADALAGATRTPAQAEALARAGALNAQAAALFQAGKGARAVQLAEQAAGIYGKVLGEKHPGYATSLINLAAMHKEAGDYSSALPLYKKAAARLEEVTGPNHPLYASGLNSLAALYGDLGEYDAALPLYRKALRIRRQALGEEHPDHATTLNNLALLYRDMGAPRAGLPFARKALDTRRHALGERHPSFATSLGTLASLYEELGEYKAALPLRKQALAALKQTLGVKHPKYAITLCGLASLYKQMGEYQAALPLYRQSLGALKAALGEAHPDHAITLQNMGCLYKEIGDPAAALPLLRRASEALKLALGEKHPEYASSLNNLAALYREMGSHRAALPLMRKALDIRRGTLGERHPDYATGLNSMAVLLGEMGDGKEAGALLSRSLAVMKETLGEKHPRYANGLSNLAMSYQALGATEAALPLMRKVVQVRRETLGERHPDYARALRGLALIHTELGEQEAALPLLERARSLAREGLGDGHPLHAATLSSLSMLVWSMKGPEAALPLTREALALFKDGLGERHPLYAVCLHQLGALYAAAGRPGAALVLQEHSLHLARRYLDEVASVQSERQQMATANHLRHRLGWRLSIPDEAAHFSHSHVLAWKGAIFAAQQARRRFSIAQADPAIRESAIALRDATRSLALLSSRQDPFSLQRSRELARDKEALEARLAQASEPFRLASRPPSGEQLRASLPTGAVLIDYLVFAGIDPGRPVKGQQLRRRLAAWVARPDAPTARIDLGPMGPVEDDIAAWRGALEKGGSSAAALRLRERLWAPLEKHLAGAKVVLISPDEALGRLPFAALPGRGEGNFLLEESPLAVLPVPRVLPQLLLPLGGKPTLLALGDVDFGAGLVEFSSLPATGPEADAVAARFRATFKGETTSLSGAKAARSRVAAALPRHRFAHLATHGFFAPASMRSALAIPAVPAGPSLALHAGDGVTGSNPGLLSGLVLAGANSPTPDDDGLLKASEIAELDLSGMELAVLSACQTGLGMEGAGEGMLGLQRAFAVAGCRSVVSSLWSVNDAATAVLMERFYLHLWGKKLPKVEALRQAQLDVMRHPEWVEKREKEMRGTPGLRGAGKVGEVVVSGKKERRSPVAWWAAWQLSGDWR